MRRAVSTIIAIVLVSGAYVSAQDHMAHDTTALAVTGTEYSYDGGGASGLTSLLTPPSSGARSSNGPRSSTCLQRPNR